MCAETDEEAIAKAEGWTFFQFALLFYNQHGPVVPGSVNLWSEYEKWKETPAGAKAQRGSGLIGSPATLRERLHKFRASNVDQVILLNQAGKNTHADICSSLELFAREVMPEFHADEPRTRRGSRRSWPARSSSTTSTPRRTRCRATRRRRRTRFRPELTGV